VYDGVPEWDDSSTFSIDDTASIVTGEEPRRMHAKYTYSSGDEGYLSLTEGMIVDVIEEDHPECGHVFLYIGFASNTSTRWWIVRDVKSG
jgi:hypothetical protein